MVGVRSFHLLLLIPYKKSDRQLRQIDSKVWGLLALFECGSIGIIIGFSTFISIATASGMIDLFVFLGQLAIYHLTKKRVEILTEKSDTSRLSQANKDRLINKRRMTV